MPESINAKTIFSLLEVTLSIQKTLNARYSNAFWVKAEMNKLNYYLHSGHCYPELIEKKDGKLIAQLKATLWKDDYNRINNAFQTILKEPLKDGIQILLQAKITFDPVYGLSLRIVDIDPAFSLGELEREKQQTIKTLIESGIINNNKTLKLPLLPGRIAIISVESSKGFADFRKVIEGNDWGYKFFYMLFPALLQGDKAVESILFQLKNIRKIISHFDVVAIIRGGGGDVGLSCYNNLELAKTLALFPIPVITGIGHATNETVTEMIAFKNAITPTELADYLLQQYHNFAVPLQKAAELLHDKTSSLLKAENLSLNNTARFFRSVTDNMLIRNRQKIATHARTLSQYSLQQIRNNKEKLAAFPLELGKGSISLLKDENNTVNNLERIVKSMHPLNVLRRGYSITSINGKSIRSKDELKPGDILSTQVADGSIVSTVTSTHTTSDEN